MPRISETRESLSSTYVAHLGVHLPRTLAKLRGGEPVTIGVIGDSKMAEGTAGNAAGTAADLLATALGTWSTSDITVVNQADSGDTMATQFLGGNVSTVAAAAPDVVLVEIGTNDSNADANGSYAAGYVKAASWAAIERACAYVRDENEACEFVFVATTPYLTSSSSNPKIVEYNAGVEALAPFVGAEFVDGYAAFTDYAANWDDLLYDSTHRNGSGNQVLADAIALHFPETGPAYASPAAPRPTSGRYGIDRVDKTAGTYLGGYRQVNSAAATTDYTYAVTGTGWATVGSDDVTSTAGDSWTLSSPRALEFFANLDLSEASSPVVDVYVDDVLQAADVDLHNLSGKNSTYYWIGMVTGLDGGAHSLKLTLKSGTLKIQTSAVLLAAQASAWSADVVNQEVYNAAATTTLTTSYQNIVASTAIDLPSGWGSMDIVFDGFAVIRCSGATTATRRVDFALRVDGVSVPATRQMGLSQQAATFTYSPLALPGLHRSATGSVNVDVIAKVDDATDTIQITRAFVSATLMRTS